MANVKELNKVITANRLRDGAIVYMRLADEQPQWEESLANATVFQESAAEEMEAKAHTDVERNVVVGPYVMDIAENRAPLSARETIRATGPSIKYGHEAQDG